MFYFMKCYFADSLKLQTEYKKIQKIQKEFKQSQKHSLTILTLYMLISFDQLQICD